MPIHHEITMMLFTKKVPDPQYITVGTGRLPTLDWCRA